VTLTLATLNAHTTVTMAITTLVGSTPGGTFVNTVKISGSLPGHPFGGGNGTQPEPSKPGTIAHAKVRVIGLPNTGHLVSSSNGAWTLGSLAPWIVLSIIFLALGRLVIHSRQRQPI
jgi:hypothetical protein